MARQFIELHHFDAHDFTHLLELESQFWDAELHWDFSSTAHLISACLGDKRLAGYALMIDRRVSGYCFSFDHGEKSLVGDLFVDPTTASLDDARALLSVTLQKMLATPAVRRVEAQLPHFSFEQLEPSFQACCFTGYQRRFMVLSLEHRVPRSIPGTNINSGSMGAEGDFLIQRWERRHDREAAALLCEAYAGHVDAAINDQYRSVAGTKGIMENILYFQGCGEYLSKASWVAIHRPTQRLAGVILLTAVRLHSGHIPQVAVARQFQARGIGTALMEAAFAELNRSGYREVSLTVTNLNQGAVRFYERLGFETPRTFGAFVWDRPEPPTAAFPGSPSPGP